MCEWIADEMQAKLKTNLTNRLDLSVEIICVVGATCLLIIAGHLFSSCYFENQHKREYLSV